MTLIASLRARLFDAIKDRPGAAPDLAVRVCAQLSPVVDALVGLEERGLVQIVGRTPAGFAVWGLPPGASPRATDQETQGGQRSAG